MKIFGILLAGLLLFANPAAAHNNDTLLGGALGAIIGGIVTGSPEGALIGGASGAVIGSIEQDRYRSPSSRYQRHDRRYGRYDLIPTRPDRYRNRYPRYEGFYHDRYGRTVYCEWDYWRQVSFCRRW